MPALDALTPLEKLSPYARAAYRVFDRVTATFEGRPFVSFIGTVLSDFEAGPSLFWVADAAAEATGLRGPFGLASCREVSGAKSVERWV